MTTEVERDFARIAVLWDENYVASAVDVAIATGRTGVRKSSMKLGPYNGFAGEMRLVADFKIKVAIKLGLIPKPAACSICGITEGRIDYHAEDYGRPFQVAAICMSCHLRLHNRHRSTGYMTSWRKLLEQHGNGHEWFDKLH